MASGGSTDNEMSFRVWGEFPRSCKFYESTIVALGNLLSFTSLDYLFNLLLKWCEESNTISHTTGNEYSLTSFLFKVKSSNPRQFDIVVSFLFFFWNYIGMSGQLIYCGL